MVPAILMKKFIRELIATGISLISTFQFLKSPSEIHNTLLAAKD